MEHVYVLKLEDNKYYIGKSKNVEKRFEEHKAGSNQWTKTYKPLKIVEQKELVGLFDEDNLTKAYMLLYGIDNVRGGSYTSYVLSEDVKNLLKSEIRHALDCCFKCGEKNHFAKDCPNA